MAAAARLSRARLSADFLTALADSFEQHGLATVRRVRDDDPAEYVRVLASLMPDESDDALSDERMAALYTLLKGGLERARREALNVH